MRRLLPRPTFVAIPVSALALTVGCGEGSSSGPAGVPGAGPAPFTVLAPGLVPGVIWELDRPIGIWFSEDVDPASITTASVHVRESGPGGAAVPGTLTLGPGGASPSLALRWLEFQPDCPTGADGSGGGLSPGGIDYTLTIQGGDVAGAIPVRAADGEALPTTFEVTFRTPTPPMQLLFDRKPGPPALVVRGDPSVPDRPEDTTRIEVGGPPPTTVSLRRTAGAHLQVDPGSAGLFPDGLPLNHWIERGHRVVLVLELDDRVDTSPANLSRVGLRFRDVAGAWRPLHSRVEVRGNCVERGASQATLHVVPEGMLPPGRPLGLFIDQGFADSVGDATIVAEVLELGVQGSASADPAGARVDAILESFAIGGDAPGSMEDTTSDLGAPRAVWAVHGGLAAANVPGGLSRARSRWYAIGEGGHDGSQHGAAPTFRWHGTDQGGRVRTSGGLVAIEPPLLGPRSVTALAPTVLTLDASLLDEPGGTYAALPSILAGDRALVTPLPPVGPPVEPAILRATVGAGSVHVDVGAGCSIPGVLTDCVPRDLTALLPGSPPPTLAVAPQSFELYSGFFRDVLDADHRVTITWDATFADASGAPDPTAAVSGSTGWVGDPTTFSGTDYDFVRFQVQFEIDVSGNGVGPLERGPVLDFVKLPFDVR